MATGTSVLDSKMTSNPGRIGVSDLRYCADHRIHLRGKPSLRRPARDSSRKRVAVHPAGNRAADRAGIRIRERISRHGERRGDGDLHALAGAARGGGMVRACGISSACWSRAARWLSRSSRCLPVELILQVGSNAGFAMVFALLIAAIIWNLGTWYFGLPASSSHTLIGSIIGVGHRQPVDVGENGHQRRGLGPGDEHREVPAAFAAGRICRRGATAAVVRRL